MRKKVAYVTRKEEFCAAHKLWNDAWSPEKNFEVFGKCANPNWHGHNYTLYVTIKGPVNEDTGFVMNITELKQIIHEKIIKKVDHKNLNLDVDFLKGKIPTTENLCIAIWEELKPVIEKNGIKLYSIRIQESEKNFFEYYE